MTEDELGRWWAIASQYQSDQFISIEAEKMLALIALARAGWFCPICHCHPCCCSNWRDISTAPKDGEEDGQEPSERPSSIRGSGADLAVAVPWSANPALTPQFLTAWEREDWEREKRGEKPLGPLATPSGLKPHNDA